MSQQTKEQRNIFKPNNQEDYILNNYPFSLDIFNNMDKELKNKRCAVSSIPPTLPPHVEVDILPLPLYFDL